jgi:hypothetical protein
MGRVMALAGVALLALAVSLPVRADVASPDEEACGLPHQEGDACVNGDTKQTIPNGICRTGPCLRVDWARENGEAPGHRPMKQVPCLKCVSIGSTPADPSKPRGCASAPAKGCSFTRTNATVRGMAPWLLAGSFSALFLVARRRRR